MTRRLSPEEFTPERWRELGESISRQQKWGKPLNPGYFFPTVQKWLRMGMAEAWGSDDNRALLVGLFSPNTYTGELGGMVFCWWSLSDAKTSAELFSAFDAETVRRDCTHQYVSVFGEVREKAMTRLYRRKGFRPHENVMVKVLR